MRILVYAAVVAYVVSATASALGQDTERRVALVIGNSSYAETPLKNPVNDARAMAQTLRTRGFQVILRENATRNQMNDAVAEFGEKLTEGSVGLFFFAGHGMQVQGRNFLIPVDARITSEQRVRLETLDVDLVLEQMAAARSRVNVVVLDACRNNPFERRFRSVAGGLAQINAPEGTLIAYATAPGKVASDGDGANGLYTTELLRALAQPGLKVEDVFKQVRVAVSRASNGNQVPWEASSLVGDFYFAPAKAVAAAPVASASSETLFWESVRDSGNAAELQAYLDRFPNGMFAPLARTRMAALTGAPNAAARTAAGVIGRSAEFPALKAGLRIYRDSVGYVEITGADGRSVKATSANGREFLLLGMFMPRPQLGRPPSREAVESIWPLEIGKTVAYDYAPNPENAKVVNIGRLQVLRTETVTVPAGTFEAFVVENHVRNVQGTFEGKWTYWYAPSVGFLVKVDYEHTAGNRPNVSPWQATRIQSPP